MTKEDAFKTLVSTIRGNIRHADYTRVTEYAERMERLVTGENLKQELIRVVHRETDRDWQLRQKFFFPVVPSACAKCRVSFQKVSRTHGFKGRFKYEGSSNESKLRDLSRAVDEFYGDENLDDYLTERYLDLDLIDPNSFIMVGFPEFDHKKEKAKPFPIEVSAREAVNFGFDRTQVSWLVAKFASTYKDDKGNPMKGHRYVMWSDVIWSFEEVFFDSANLELLADDMPAVLPQYVRIGKSSYLVTLMLPFDKTQKPEFPGIRVGHVKDPVTRGRTFVSPLHSGINRMLETLKVGSELSLVMAMVAIPQIYMYLPPCDGGGKREDGSIAQCVKGKDPSTGSACTVCEGTGKRLPKTVLDMMVLDLPPRATNDDLIDLAKLKHHSAPDVAILEFALQYKDALETKIILDVFATISSGSSASVASTATQVLIDEDAENNAVYPFARKRATVWVKLVRMCAFFVDAIEGLQVEHPVPDNLQLSSTDRLLDSLQKARTATASPTITDSIEEDIVSKQLRDRPEELLKYRTQKKFRPYRSMNDTMRQALVIGGQGGERERVLFIYEDEIYRVLERENPKFYSLVDKEQEELISKQVDLIVAREEEARAKREESAFAGEDVTV